MNSFERQLLVIQVIIFVILQRKFIIQAHVQQTIKKNLCKNSAFNSHRFKRTTTKKVERNRETKHHEVVTQLYTSFLDI